MKQPTREAFESDDEVRELANRVLAEGEPTARRLGYTAEPEASAFRIGYVMAALLGVIVARSPGVDLSEAVDYAYETVRDQELAQTFYLARQEHEEGR